MRMSLDKVRQAILHPEIEARRYALAYFTESYTADPAVFRLVVDAVEAFGWDRAFPVESLRHPMAADGPAVDWLIEQVTSPPLGPAGAAHWRQWQLVLGRQLARAPAALLAARAGRIDCRAFRDVCGDRLADEICEKLRLAEAGPEACWRELEAICEERRSAASSGDFEPGRPGLVLEAVAAADGRFDDRSLALLADRVEDFDDNPQVWMQYCALRLAGRRGLRAAVPWIVERMIEDVDYGGDWFCEACRSELIRIGGDDTVRRIAAAFREEGPEFQIYVYAVLGRIHSDLAHETALELLSAADDDVVRTGLAWAVVAQLDPDTLPVALEVIRTDRYDPYFIELRNEVVAAGCVTGARFAEFDAWREQSRAATQRPGGLLEPEHSGPGLD